MDQISTILTASNLQEICKCCLELKPQILPITSEVEFHNSNIPATTITEILQKVTSQALIPKHELQVPMIICNPCFDELKTAYLFILKYEEAQRRLEEFVTEQELAEGAAPVPLDSDSPPVRITRTTKKRARKAKKAGPKSPNPGKKYPCPVCIQEFSALDLREHAHTHKALKRYLSIPEEHKVSLLAKFSSRRYLDQKKVGIFQRQNRLHTCPFCHCDFPVGEFRAHLDVHRKQDEFKCDKCERVFKKLNHLNTHRVKHLKEYPYKCDQCGKGFVIKTNYDCHILTHTNDELPHECKFCLRRFSNPEHLARHQLIHTENVSYSVKYKVSRCHSCLKTFKDKEELQKHDCVPLQQTINARFPCKTCKKVFKHASGLYNHIRNIHKLKGAKTLCSVCGKNVSNIYHHMMRHSGEKPYSCDQCEKRFIGKPQLKQHLLVHSGLKPFVCSVCAKAFNNLYNLQVHERIHAGDRCHVCSMCGKGFLEKSYLKKHMNVHMKTA